MPGFDCSVVRSEFPSLERGIIYLDNAASTLKPRRVVEAMREFSYTSYANVHRGVHTLSMEASKRYEDAHETVGRLVGGSWDEIVFVRNTTEAMQLAALSLALNGVLRGGEVIVTEADHHSTLLPWVRAARLGGASVKLLPVDDRGVPRWDLLGELLSEKTRVVAFGHVSNVTGAVAPVEDIAKAARSVGALVVLDSAQGVPHLPVDFRGMGVDIAAFSGHKMLGPTGIGVLWARRDLLEELEPPLGGGGTVSRVRLSPSGGVSIEWDEPPWKFEAGTPPIIEAIGLAEAAEMLREIGMSEIARHEDLLTEKTMKLLEPLHEEGVIRYVGPSSPGERHGIVSFVARGRNPDEIGLLLDRRGIAVRTGLHCAHILHDRLGVPEGSVRASFYIYNCPSDVEALATALEDILLRKAR